MDYDCIILGAGMSGLAAGIRLAHFGKQVCILEKHSMPGGLNSFYRLNGHAFDVGLHAVTNYVPKEARHTPLSRVLRQLRLKHEDFQLAPQRQSAIAFPGVTLRFGNDFELLEYEVAGNFPAQIDNFRRLLASLPTFDAAPAEEFVVSARRVLADYLTDPLLLEMLLCPILFYGSPREDDVEWGAFAILFRSIYCEGFARPRAGVRQIIGTLLKQYKANHGALRLKTGVARLIAEQGRVAAVELENGETLTARTILSSAGYVETMRLCSDLPAPAAEIEAQAGRVTFIESIALLDTPAENFGHTQSIVFFNNAERFAYRPPAALADPRSGVFCAPGNYLYDAPLEEHCVRLTNLANYHGWKNLTEPEYKEQKTAWYQRCAAEAVKFVPDFRPHVRFVDTFTPRTIEFFTGHRNGAVYGMPRKRKDGRTHLANLFLCGTDQGLLGIVGAMLSGIAMANEHVLKA